MKVVIVGGGFGGVKTALELANKDGFEVVLITQNADFEYHGALYRSATGSSPLEVVLRIGDILHHAKNVEIVIDKITALNNRVKMLRGETGQTYTYDTLVLGMGSVKNYFGIQGLEEYSHTMYTIKDTLELRHDLVKMFSLAHKDNVRIAVIGAGPSGVELSGELQNFANAVAEKYSLKPKKVHVSLIEGADRVLPLLDPKASDLALKRLQKIGVEVKLHKKVIKCSRNIVHLDDTECAADIIVWTAGSKPVDFYAKYPEVFTLKNGKVNVNELLQTPKDPHIYVIGDNASTLYSGMAQTALTDAIFVSHNLIHYAAHGTVKLYTPKKPIYVVPISGKWAVAEINGKVRSGRFGWSVRRKADLFIFKNFEPMKKALKTWRQANHRAEF